MDAGGCKGSVIARMIKIEGLSFLVRGVRQRNQVKQWKKVHKEEYKEYTDPGDPKKKIIVADTRTKIRGCKEPIRTILILNEKEKKEKDKLFLLRVSDHFQSPLYFSYHPLCPSPLLQLNAILANGRAYTTFAEGECPEKGKGVSP